MTRASGVVLVIAALAVCAGCGGASSQEVQTARSARYTCGVEQVHDAVGRAMEEVFYQVGSSDAESGIVRSETRWFEETGRPRERGAAIVDDKDVLVTAEARITKDGAALAVSIAADVVEYLQGSPQGRRLAADNPTRPAWVQGKIDRMTVVIHERLQGCSRVSAQP